MEIMSSLMLQMIWVQVILTEVEWYPLLSLSLSLPLPPHLRTHTEALSRFLKAKLRVMQEEIDRLCQELTDKVSLEVATCIYSQ